MAEPIVIRIGLDAADITQATGKIRAGVRSALDAALPDARETGRRIGSALADGIAEGLKRAQTIKAQLDQVLGSGTRQRTVEAQERAHQQRLAEIRERGAQQQAAIAARAAAQAERDARRIAEAQEKAFRRAQPPDSLIGFFKRYSSTLREAGESIQQAGFGLAALTGGIFELGRRAVSATIDIDKQVNVLKALTGSAETAERRYAALIAVSQKTPGLTTNLAATLDAQLRVASVTEKTIDRILPAIGKLNAVSNLQDPQRFAQNLVQLVTQNFERTDLKELVGQSPLAGEIIKNLFNVDSPTNAQAIRESAKKLGLTTTDAFFTAFAEAAANNPKLANVTESLGTQFEKLRDRVLVALRPLGLAIVQALTPLVESAVPIIERLASAFSSLSPTAQQAIIVIAGVAAAAAPLTIALGALIQTFGALGNIITVLSGLFGSGGLLAGAGAAVAGFAAAIPPVGLALGALALAIGGTVAAYQLFGDTAEQAAVKTKADLVTTQERIRVGQLEINSLRNLQEQTSLNAAEQAKIKELYDALDPVQKARVGVYAEEAGGVDTLTGRLAGLVQVLDEVNQKRQEALSVSAVQTGGNLISQIQVANLNDYSQQIADLNLKIKEYAEKSVEAEKTGERFGRSLATPGVAAVDVYNSRIRELTAELNKLQGFADTNQKQYRALALAFQEAAKASGKTTEEFIRQAIAASGLNGDLTALERRLRQFAGTGASQNSPSRAALLAQGAIAGEIKPEKRPGTGGGSSGDSSESKARQLREALLSQQKTFLEQNQRLLEDANKRELDATRELYDQKSITAQQYFAEKTRLEQASISASIAVTQQEIANAEATLAKTKPGTVERIRLEAELFKLRTDLTIKSREFYASEIDNIQATTKALLAQRKELLGDLERFAVKLDDSQLPTAQIGSGLTPQQERAQETLRRTQEAALQFRVQDIELQRQEVAIQNAISAGVLTEAEGRTATLALQRQYRDVLIQSLEIQKQATIDPEVIGRLNVQIEQLRTLGQELTPAQAFFKGFRSEAETLAESFERIGKSFKDSVMGVVDSGIDALTKKLGFFKSLVGDILKSLTRVLLGNLLQPRGAAIGGGGGGGFLGSVLGSVFGGGGGGSFGSFATGGFAGGGGAASLLGGGSGGGGLLGALSGALGGGISAPPSVTSSPFSLGSLGNLFGGGNRGFSPIIQDSVLGNRQLGGLGGLGSLFSGIGFGKAPGSGGALASALPLLGVSLGAGLGTDRLTSLLGGIGGGLLGVGLTAAPGIIGAGGALSGLGFLAPLFSNPFTAIAGAAILPLAFLLGRARQRRRDESASGDFLQEAVDNIREMKRLVESNELVLTVADARKQFERDILQPFIAQINTLKTKSVRESRLKNQTVDLRNLFEKEVIPAIQAQKTRQGINDKIIPEFATGGIHYGVGLALLHNQEAILNQTQQARLQQITGSPNILQQIGVPGASPAPTEGTPSFASGGIFTAPTRASIVPTINMTVQLMVSPSEAVNILNAAASTDDGQIILVNAQKQAARNGLGMGRTRN